MPDMMQIDCEIPIAHRETGAGCDLGLDHPHPWARDSRRTHQGLRAAQPQAIGLPSTVRHDDIHYAG